MKQNKNKGEKTIEPTILYPVKVFFKLKVK